MIASEENFGESEVLSKTGFTRIWKNIPMLKLLDSDPWQKPIWNKINSVLLKSVRRKKNSSVHGIRILGQSPLPVFLVTRAQKVRVKMLISEIVLMP